MRVGLQAASLQKPLEYINNIYGDCGFEWQILRTVHLENFSNARPHNGKRSPIVFEQKRGGNGTVARECQFWVTNSMQ